MKNFGKKALLLLMFVCAMLFMTACGADVHSDIALNNDGSGTRTVYAEISNDDQSRINGGFDALQQVLTQSAPSGITVNRSADDTRGTTIFSFSYAFTSLDDYKTKTNALTGSSTDAAFTATNSVLNSSIHFEESDNLNNLIKWATDAIDSAQIIQGYSASSCYDLEGTSASTVSDTAEKYYQSNVEYDAGTGPLVTTMNVLTKYDTDGTQTKEIQIVFDQIAYSTLNTADAITYLKKQYGVDAVADATKNALVIDLKDQTSMKAFFDKAAFDISSQYPVNAKFNFVNNQKSIFGNTFSVQEDYQMDTFVNEFHMQHPVVYTYLSLPDLDYSTKSYTFDYDTLDSDKQVSGYQYSGELTGDYYSSVDFESQQSVQMNSISVNCVFDKNWDAKVTTTCSFSKNGLDISQDTFNKHYGDSKDQPTYSENGDEVTVSFTKSVPASDAYTYNEGINVVKNKSASSSFKKNVLTINASYDAESYIDATYAPSSNVSYTFEIPKSAGIVMANANGTIYEANQLKEALQKGNYVFTTSALVGEVIPIAITAEQTNTMYSVLIGVIITVCVLVIVVILIIVIVVIGKKQKKKKAGSTAAHIQEKEIQSDTLPVEVQAAEVETVGETVIEEKAVEEKAIEEATDKETT